MTPPHALGMNVDQAYLLKRNASYHDYEVGLFPLFFLYVVGTATIQKIVEVQGLRSQKSLKLE